MYSKLHALMNSSVSALFTATILFSLLFLASCGLKIGEESKNKETVVVQSIACLDTTMTDLKLFVAGDATEDQVSFSIDCLQSVFAAFNENIRGDNKDAFTAKEIAIFIEKNFIKDGSQFSDSFLNEFMNLKTALIGGNNKLILKAEVNSIIQLLKELKPDLVRLNKSMKIVVFKWDKDSQPPEEKEKEKLFLTAKKDLQVLIESLSAAFAKSGNAYQMEDLFNFAREVLLFSKSKASALETIERARPFLKKFKVVLIGGDVSLAKSEWRRLGLTLHEGLFQILRYNYFLKDLDAADGDAKWAVYEKIAVDLSGLIEELLDVKELKTLTNFELYEISQSLDQVYPNLMLSLPLIETIGRLKVMLLGDSPSGRIGWSKSDFTRLRAKIPSLFKQLSTLVKTYNYLQSHQLDLPPGRTSPEQFEQIETDTLAAVEELAVLIEQPFNIFYIKIMAEELSKTIFKDVLVLPENFESLFAVALSAKTVLTGEQDNNLDAKKLALLLKIGARAYLHYIEYNIFLKPLAREQSDFYARSGRLFEKTIATLGLNLKLKDSKIYSTDELTQLILTLQSEKIIATKISKSSLDSLFLGLWQNVFNKPEDRLDQEILPGFNAVALQQVTQEFTLFIKTQKVLTEMSESLQPLSQEKLVDEIKKVLTATADSELRTGLKEILKLISGGIQLNFNSDGFLKILTTEPGIYSFDDLMKSNVARAVSRLAIRSYAGDMERVRALTGITEPELLVAFKQFRGLAVDTELILPTNTSFLASRFMEANLFLATSNGDQYANFGEVHQLLIHILSGMARADMLKQRIVQSCLPPQQGPVTASTGVWEDCLLDLFYTENASYKDLPQFMNMRSKFPAAEMKGYYLSLLKAVGHIPNEKKVVYFVDIDLFLHVVQYVEMVYARHDTNRDTVLEKCEALKAFPIFRDLIKELTKEFAIADKQLPGVFIYLLKFGRPPKSLAEKLKFLSFINSPDKWDIKATRLDLGKIFNFIGESTSIQIKTPVSVEPKQSVSPQPQPDKPIITGCEVAS